MAFQQQELMFGDFEALTHEERNKVIKILYGPRDERKVEFPWDTSVDMPDGAYGEYYGNAAPSYSVSTDAGKVPNLGPTSAVSFPPYTSQGEMNPQQPGFHGASSLPYSVIQSQNDVQFLAPESMTLDGRNTGHQGGMATPETHDLPKGEPGNNIKPYERRNKKKRPADYYQKMENQMQTELATRNEISMQTEAKNEIGSWADSFPDELNHSQGYGQTDFIAQPQQNYQNVQGMPPLNQQTNAPSQPVNMVPSQNEEYYQQQLPWQHQQNSRDLRNKEPVHYIPQQHVSNHFEQHSVKKIITGGDVTNLPSEREQTPVDTSMAMLSHNMSDLQVGADYCQPSDQHEIQPSQQPHTNNYPVTASQKAPTNCVNLDEEYKQETVEEHVSNSNKKDSIENMTMETECNVERNPIRNDLNTTQSDSGASQNQNLPPKPKSWAGLFKNVSSPPTAQVGLVIPHDDSAPPLVLMDKSDSEKDVPKEAVSTEQDGIAKHIGDILSGVKINHAQVGLQPRGLINRGNWCYINATLQALVACPPFYNLLKKLPVYSQEQRGPSSTPVMDSFVEFVHAFSPYVRNNDKGIKGRKFAQEIVSGPEFEPVHVYKMLQVMQANQTFKLGRQEDAEEFLSCILDGLHEEMAAVIRLATGKEAPEPSANANGYIDEDDDESEEDFWEQVGPKKKSVVTRRASFGKSPIADIFVGYTRSAVYKASAKESANLQPFFTIQLDIQSEKVWTVRDALDGLVSKESISGYTCSKTNTELEVARKTTFEELPSVLMLHLKYFVYDKDGGCQKLLKKVDYTVDLEITKDLLSPNVKTKLTLSQRSYKLFAVVFHHGKLATGGGHYTTAVFHPAINGWILIDDNVVKPVPLATVLKYTSPRVPYLLYYRRLDVHS